MVNEPKLVLVMWMDSMGYDGWMTLPADLQPPKPALAHSVGWLVRDEDGVLTVAPHVLFSTSQASGVMEIPRMAVIALQELPGPVPGLKFGDHE